LRLVLLLPQGLPGSSRHYAQGIPPPQSPGRSNRTQESRVCLSAGRPAQSFILLTISVNFGINSNFTVIHRNFLNTCNQPSRLLVRIAANLTCVATQTRTIERRSSMISLARLSIGIAVLATGLMASEAMADTSLTFHKDIQPILQDKCVNCHRTGGAGPMPLVHYDEVLPYAGLIMYKTGLKDRMGAMPPFYLERDNGIQDYKNNPALSEEQIAMIAEWAQNGAPQGDRNDAPELREFDDGLTWRSGTPDLVIRSAPITMKAGQPDWWGAIPDIPIPLDEERYIRQVEIREINDVDRSKTSTSVGGQFIVHHMQRAIQGFDAEGNPEGIRPFMPIH